MNGAAVHQGMHAGRFAHHKPCVGGEAAVEMAAHGVVLVRILRRTVGTRTYRGGLRPAAGDALIIVQLAVCSEKRTRPRIRELCSSAWT